MALGMEGTGFLVPDFTSRWGGVDSCSTLFGAGRLRGHTWVSLEEFVALPTSPLLVFRWALGHCVSQVSVELVRGSGELIRMVSVALVRIALVRSVGQERWSVPNPSSLIWHIG